MTPLAAEGAPPQLQSGNDAPGSRLGFVILSVLGLGLAWFTLAFGIAAGSVHNAPGWLRVGWLGSGGTPSSQSIKDAVAKAETPQPLVQADSQAKRALTTRPLDTLALEALMTSAAKQKILSRADELAQLIVRRDARSTEAQLWLFARQAAAGNYVESLSHADLAMRADQDSRPKIYPWLSALVADRRATPPLVTILARDPSWRGGFLDALARDNVAWRNAGPVFQALQGTSRPPTPEEVQPYLATLVANQQYSAAYLLWLQSLPEGGLKRVTLLYDPNFEGLPGAEPFNWGLSKANGGYGEFEASEVGKGRVLHVGYGGDISVSLAHQTVLLTPGRYVLTGRYAPDGENASGQFRIALTCLAARGGDHLVDAPLSSAGVFSLAFEVPQSGCEAQQLNILGNAMPDPKPASARFSSLNLQQYNVDHGQ